MMYFARIVSGSTCSLTRLTGVQLSTRPVTRPPVIITSTALMQLKNVAPALQAFEQSVETASTESTE